MNKKNYYVFIDIDIDCEESLDDLGLNYQKSKDNESRNIIEILLKENEYSDLFKNINFNNTNHIQLSTYLLKNFELGQFSTRVTISKPNGDNISFY